MPLAELKFRFVQIVRRACASSSLNFYPLVVGLGPAERAVGVCHSKVQNVVAR